MPSLTPIPHPISSQSAGQRSSDAVIEEIVELRRLGFRYIALADDNFYPVSLTDLKLAARNNPERLKELNAIRATMLAD